MQVAITKALQRISKLEERALEDYQLGIKQTTDQPRERVLDNINSETKMPYAEIQVQLQHVLGRMDDIEDMLQSTIRN